MTPPSESDPPLEPLHGVTRSEIAEMVAAAAWTYRLSGKELEDVVQETVLELLKAARHQPDRFLKMLDLREDNAGEGAMVLELAWATARRIFNTEYQRDRRRRLLKPRRLDPILLPPQTPPDQVLIRRETLARYKALIPDAEASRIEIFEMLYELEMTFEQVADHLGRSVQYVVGQDGATLRRIRLRLSKCEDYP